MRAERSDQRENCWVGIVQGGHEVHWFENRREVRDIPISGPGVFHVHSGRGSTRAYVELLQVGIGLRGVKV